MRIALLGNPDSLHVQRWSTFLHSRGHELLLVADPHTSHRPEGIPVAVPRWTMPLNIAAFRLTPRPHGNALWKPLLYRPLIREFRPDVVHGFEAYYNGLATAWSGPYAKVLSPWGRDVYFDAHGDRLGRWMVRHAMRGVDRITCNDPSIAPYLVETFGIENSKVISFSWGIDLGVFHGVEPRELEPLRRELRLEERAPVLFSPRKWGTLWGSDRLIDALPEVLREVKDAIIVLIGPASNDAPGNELRRQLESRVDSSRLRWLPPDRTSATMAQLFNLADAFVSAAPRDLLSLTILEGMACGCLPILTDLPAYRSRVANERTALLVQGSGTAPLAGAIVRGLRDAELRSRAAKENVERILREEDASVNMLKMEDVYAAALEVAGRGAKRS